MRVSRKLFTSALLVLIAGVVLVFLGIKILYSPSIPPITQLDFTPTAHLGFVVIIVGWWVGLASVFEKIRLWLISASLSTLLIGGGLVLINGWGIEYVLTQGDVGMTYVPKTSLFAYIGLALIASGIVLIAAPGIKKLVKLAQTWLSFCPILA